MEPSRDRTLSPRLNPLGGVPFSIVTETCSSLASSRISDGPTVLVRPKGFPPPPTQLLISSKFNHQSLNQFRVNSWRPEVVLGNNTRWMTPDDLRDHQAEENEELGKRKQTFEKSKPKK